MIRFVSTFQQLLLFIFISKGLCGLVDNSTAAEYDYYRLPTSVQPEKYHLEILTNMDNLTFTGKVRIQLNILQDTNNITLHVDNLTIEESKTELLRLNQGKTEASCIKSKSVNNEYNYYILHLCKNALHGEKYVLNMRFSAPLNKKLFGYYVSSYKDPQRNMTIPLAITQFEPAHARSAFPCFDEPDFKAKFTIVLGHHVNYTAISNMPQKENRSIEGLENYIWTEFEESVLMSTYLIAYTINDFSFIQSESNTNNKALVSTWARPNAIQQCTFAAELAPKILRFYEEFFKIDFPLKKIDQIAIPDFGSGGMENWGLVTYREILLLCGKDCSEKIENIIASVVAHELAHQWFGNLVTMKWWTDIWLNEGFATYIAGLGVDHVYPDWHSFEKSNVESIMRVFKDDSRKSSHPVSQPIMHADAIYQSFDSISYQKGSTVIRMMHNFLGDLSFISGIENYLRTYSYGNAEQDNLWSALTDSAHKTHFLPKEYNVKQIMDSWTLQTGYPVLTITRNYDNNTAKITQKRYLLPTETSNNAENQCWWVPLSYTSKGYANFSDTSSKEWLECNISGKETIKLIENMPPKEQWVIFNIKLTGLYRINYDERNWNMLIETLMSDEFHKIHVINRAQLIEDALALAWTGDQSYDVAFQLLQYLVREEEFIPWKTALYNLERIQFILLESPLYQPFMNMMGDILRPIYLNITKNHDDSSSLTSFISYQACNFDLEDCTKAVRSYFDKWRKVPNPDEYNPIPIDMRSTVYCSALRHGNVDDWEFLWNRYIKSDDIANEHAIISNLGCTREVWLLKRYISYIFNETSYIRAQDARDVFISVAQTDSGFHVATEYYLENFEFISNFFGKFSTSQIFLTSTIAELMTTWHHYNSLKNVLNKNYKNSKEFDRILNNALESVLVNIEWKKRHFESISKILRSRSFETSKV